MFQNDLISRSCRHPLPLSWFGPYSEIFSLDVTIKTSHPQPTAKFGRAGTKLAAPYSSGTVISSSLRKDLYTPKGFFDHAASLPQTFVHWGIFLTAASRRSLGSVSVPVRRVALSRPLPVIALVSYYLTN